MSPSTNAHMRNFDSLTSGLLHPAAKKALTSLPDYAYFDSTKLYHESRSARMLLDSARASIAARLNVNAEEVSFIPSGNAGLDLIVSGLLNATNNKKVVASSVEQKAIIERLKSYESNLVSVDNFARINEKEFIEKLESIKPGLAILQFSNHEVGTQQPLHPIYKKCQELQIPLFVDASMTAGLVNVGTDWDVLLLKPSSWGAPIGLDILIVKRNVMFKSILLDDGRENHKFSSNVFIPQAVAIGASLEAINEKRSETAKSLSILIKDLREQLSQIENIILLGDSVARLPHVLSFLIVNVDGEFVSQNLSKKGFAVSSGSSCTPDAIKPSHVLSEMGYPNQAHIRVSLSFDTTKEDIDDFVVALTQTLSEI